MSLCNSLVFPCIFLVLFLPWFPLYFPWFPLYFPCISLGCLFCPLAFPCLCFLGSEVNIQAGARGRLAGISMALLLGLGIVAAAPAPLGTGVGHGEQQAGDGSSNPPFRSQDSQNPVSQNRRPPETWLFPWKPPQTRGIDSNNNISHTAPVPEGPGDIAECLGWPQSGWLVDFWRDPPKS